MAQGDVIFYRPAKANSMEDLEDIGFETFPVAAAYAQTIPYTDFRPWHHVAISISEDDSRVIGFPQDQYRPAEQRPVAVLEATDGAPGEDQARQRLRPPPKVAAKLVEAAEAQEANGATYAGPGLLPFAMIMTAWMIPNAYPGRQQLRTQAFGASTVVRQRDPNGESCTTAVAQAVEEAQGSPLTFTEPTPPRSPDKARWFGTQPQIQVIRDFIARLQNPLERMLGGRRIDEAVVFLQEGTPFVTAPPGNFRAALAAGREIVDRASLDSALKVAARVRVGDLFGLGPNDEASSGGFAATAELAVGLEAGMNIVSPGTDLGAAASERPQPLQLQSTDYLVSPAVLWEALLDAGFRDPDQP